MYFTDFTTTPSRTTSSTTTILVDTPESPTTTIEDNVETPESPTTTIESPASPTTTYNLELERSFGHYDYSTASTSTTSSCTKFIFPPSTSPSNKHCINDCDDSSTSSTDDEFHNINLPKLKKYKIDFFPEHHITYVLKEARSTVRATRPATTPAPPPFTRPSFQPINVPISIGSFVGYRRSISPSTKEYVVARVENIVDFDTMCEVKVLRRRTGSYDPEYIFYTFDVAESEYTHRVDLVLLSVPLLHLYELEDTRRFVHKYIFHPNIEMDIENYFNSLNENTH